MLVNGATVEAMHAALNALSLAQRVSANNIANVNTPYFAAQRVDFKDSLRAAIAAGDPDQARATIRPTGAPAGLNGNNVDLNQEFSGSTGLHYQLMTDALNRHFLLLRASVK